MTITFKCEHCHKEIQAPDSAAGKRGQCPYCKQGNYIPAAVSEEDTLPLAPIDEEEERRHQAQVQELLKQERELRSEPGGTEAAPLEHREELKTEDLHHFVVNYCLDMSDSNLERARTHAAQLKKYANVGLEAVEEFASGKALEPALDKIPAKVLQGFLTKLREELKKK